jgi:hypothetical protein
MGREGTAIGMFDSIQCNYPLPLPLEIVDHLPNIYDLEFQTKDFDNLLDEYILNEDGTLSLIKKQYQWKDDDNAFLKGYMDIVSEEIVSSSFHGVVNFYCYETVEEDLEKNKAKDITIDYLAKFTDGKIDFIEVLSYEIIDTTVRTIELKNLIKKREEEAKRWYNKYIFNTKFWRFFKWTIIIAPINLIKKVCDKLYWAAVRYL